MAVGLREDQRFRRFPAVRVDAGFHRRLHFLQDLANLTGIDHRAVEFGVAVDDVFLSLRPALGAGFAVAMVHPFLGLHLGALGGDLGLDLVDVVADIHAIDHGLLVAVLGDHVLVEEAVSALVGRRGEANEEGIEVIEHLLPQVVDAAVAFVDDDEVELFDRHLRVVLHHARLRNRLPDFVERDVFAGVRKLGAGQDRIHALDGADADLRMRIEAAGAEPLHVVQLGELAAVVGRRVGHEFLMRLLAEVAGVDEKQDAPGAAELEQAVDGGDRGEGLAGAGGHVDEGARLVLRQRLLQPGDGADLAVAQVALGQRRHLLEPTAQSVRVRSPVGQRLRTEEMEQLAGARRGIGAIGEIDDLPGAFVEKTQRCPGLAPFQGGIGIALGLDFVNAEVVTGLVALGLDHADRLSIDEQHVVSGSAVGRVFAHRDAESGAEVRLPGVLHNPTRKFQLAIDLFTRLGFWCHPCRPCSTVWPCPADCLWMIGAVASRGTCLAGIKTPEIEAERGQRKNPAFAGWVFRCGGALAWHGSSNISLRSMGQGEDAGRRGA